MGEPARNEMRREDDGTSSVRAQLIYRTLEKEVEGGVPDDTEAPDAVLEIKTSIDHAGFPHIFESIFTTLVSEAYDTPDPVPEIYTTLLSFRAANKELKRRVDAIFFDHVIFHSRVPQGQSPAGLVSRFGRIPALYDYQGKKFRRNAQNKLVSESKIRVVDYNGSPYAEVMVRSTPIHTWRKYLAQVVRTASYIDGVEVLRHANDLEFSYDKFGWSPRKVVRFLDVRQMWKPQRDQDDARYRLSLPPSVEELVVNLSYTHDWGVWTEFLRMNLDAKLRTLTFVFRAKDGNEAQAEGEPWRFRPFGILAPIFTTIIVELMISHRPMDVTFVDLPTVDGPWQGSGYTAASDTISLYVDLIKARLTGPPPEDVVAATSFTEEEATAQLARFKFISLDEYADTLSPRDFIENTHWCLDDRPECFCIWIHAARHGNESALKAMRGHECWGS